MHIEIESKTFRAKKQAVYGLEVAAEPCWQHTVHVSEAAWVHTLTKKLRFLTSQLAGEAQHVIMKTSELPGSWIFPLLVEASFLQRQNWDSLFQSPGKT